MKITVFGTGYVGLVSGTCFAEVGNEVVCVDVDADKIAKLNDGEIPIYEPGLEPLVRKNHDTGRLQFTTDAAAAVAHGDIIFIAVGTPPDEDGSADLQYVLAVAQTIAEHMSDYKVVVDKSTVPVGTADKVKARMQATLADKSTDQDVPFDVVSNPEFLKEGAAIEDFMKPDRVVIGSESERATDMMRQLYAPFNRNRDRLIEMDIRSAELTKYAANAMLATKISFMNELANLAERLGADIENVRHGIGSDSRIGYSFIYPGCGYGGSCFPKDVNALVRTAQSVDYEPELLNAVEAVNQRQKSRLFEKLQKHFDDELQGKKIAVWGLSFKPGTDDMREAPSRVLMESLWDVGASVAAYDPEAMQEAERIYGNRSDLALVDSPDAALQDADALVVVTEWKEFRTPDISKIKSQLKQPVIVDGRNLYDVQHMVEQGITYYAIGRGAN